MIRPNKRGPCRPELADAFLLALRYPEILRLHPLRFSPKVSSLQLSSWNVFFAHNSSFPSLFPTWTSPPVDSGLGHLEEMTGASSEQKYHLFLLPLLSSCPLPGPNVLANGCSSGTQKLAPKSRQAQPSPAKPSKATNDLTDVWQRNEGLLLQPLNLGVVYHTALSQQKVMSKYHSLVYLICSFALTPWIWCFRSLL